MLKKACSRQAVLGLCTFIFGFLFASVPLGAHAHLMSGGYGTINVAGSLAYVVVNVPASALTGVDDNADGLIDASELQRHDQTVRAQFASGLRLSDSSTNTVAQWLEIMPSLVHGAASDHAAQGASPELVFMAIAQFLQTPSKPKMTFSLWHKAKLKHDWIQSLRFWEPTNPIPQKTQIQFKLTVSQADAVVAQEIATLNVGRPTHQFFAPLSQQLALWFTQGLAAMTQDIDHVLFLIILLASSFSPKRWFTLLATLTLAHCSLFFLAAFTRWQLPPVSLIEPLVALSIALLATFGLMRIRLKVLAEVQITFALGLIHAAAFFHFSTSYFASARPTLLQLASIKLGVIGGYLLIAAIFFGLIQLARRIPVPVLRLFAKNERFEFWQQSLFGLALLLALGLASLSTYPYVTRYFN